VGMVSVSRRIHDGLALSIGGLQGIESEVGGTKYFEERFSRTR
jgi:hypothetical protein